MEMKRKNKFSFLLILTFGFLGFSAVRAQETNETALKNLLANKNFIFKAQSAWPLQGTVVQLNPGFDMRLLSDSINRVGYDWNII